jgi:hypothetical protein
MIEIVRISKEGTLIEIKEVSDKYRDQPYTIKKNK